MSRGSDQSPGRNRVLIDERAHWRKLLWVALFGISMGYFEAAVVVYLRELFYPEGFVFPLEFNNTSVCLVEVGREAASMLMLVTVAALSARSFYRRLAYFFFIFAVWDITYYVFLNVLIGWPGSIMTWDILFLIPVTWVSPVLAPVLVSVTFIVTSVTALWLDDRGASIRLRAWEWLAGTAVAVLIVASFVANADVVTEAGAPSHYNWGIFATAELCWALLFTAGVITRIRSAPHTRVRKANSELSP